MAEYITKIEKYFKNYDEKATSKDNLEILMLYRLFISLSEDVRYEIDSAVLQLDRLGIKNMGFVSCFEAVMKCVMFKASPHKYHNTMQQIRMVAEKKAVEYAEQSA